MKEFQQKTRFRKLIFSPAAAGIIVIVLVFLILATFNVYKKSKQANLKRDEAKEQLKDLEERKEYLVGEIERLQSVLGIEEEIRNKFQFAKPGETTVVIIDENKDEPATVDEENKKTFWQKLFGQ